MKNITISNRYKYILAYSTIDDIHRCGVDRNYTNVLCNYPIHPWTLNTGIELRFMFLTPVLGRITNKMNSNQNQNHTAKKW